MAQVKVYGHRQNLVRRREALSNAIHTALMECFGLPAEKRFQRFIAIEPEDYIYPTDRSERYTILEISIFEGRSPEAKRRLIARLFELVDERAGIEPQDLEITIFETPRANWGIRGRPGDELGLSYKVDV